MEETPKPIGRPRKVDVLQALRLRVQNHLSYQEIADRLGCTKGAVWQTLSAFKNLVENPEAVGGYIDARAKLLTAVEFELLKDVLDAEKRQKASLNNTAYAFQQVFNARRLTEGQSTDNVGLLAAIISSDDVGRNRQKGQESGPD